MRKVRSYYRTKDGRADYRFCFEEQQNGSWRIYILEQPSYGNRPTNGHATHRLVDAENRMYVCWNSEMSTLMQAKQVAALWANGTQKYILTGAQF